MIQHFESIGPVQVSELRYHAIDIHIDTLTQIVTSNLKQHFFVLELDYTGRYILDS